MNQIDFLFIGFLLLMAGAIVSIATCRMRLTCSWLSFFFTLAAASCFLYTAVVCFRGGAIKAAHPWLTLPGIGAHLTMGVDSLSALLLLIISIISVCTSLFSVKYTLRYGNESLSRYYPFLLLVFTSAAAVVVVRDMFFFIVFWEVMTLSSYALIIYERSNESSIKAGFAYFLVTHIATACMIIATIIIYTKTPEPHSFDFAAFSAAFKAIGTEDSALLHFVLGLFFIGFATKAGVLPFGFWLPNAYPAAPSGATATLAGMVEKAAIYAILLVFCKFLPISHHSYVWGQVLAVFGAVSIFVGTMSALSQDGAKRLMSFHAIGQIGYMLLGIGLGIFLLPINPPLAGIALIGGLFHMINHSWFKSCLFLNAGCILYSADTDDLNKVGGLLKIMPFTGITAIIASLSIAGIPPFNGYSSKLLLFESSITAGKNSPHFVFLGFIAIFISAVTLASFVKFLCTAFLERFNVGENSKVVNIPMSMKIPQGILALLCIVFGLAPLLPIRIIHDAIKSTLPIDYMPSLASVFGKSWAGFTLNFGQGLVGAWNPIWVSVVMVAFLALGYVVSRAGMAKTREAETWYGGRYHDAEQVRYASHSFYVPFKNLFAFSLGGIRFEGAYPKSVNLPRLRIPEALKNFINFDRWFYYPFAAGFMEFSRRFSRVHIGIPQVYLLWMILGVIACIVVLFMLPAG